MLHTTKTGGQDTVDKEEERRLLDVVIGVSHHAPYFESEVSVGHVEWQEFIGHSISMNTADTVSKGSAGGGRYPQVCITMLKLIRSYLLWVA
jgi:hypothetical protein